MIALAALGLLIPALTVLRGRTLAAYLAADATTWLMVWIVSLRSPAIEPRLALALVVAVKGATFAVFLARGTNVRWSANRAAVVAAIAYAAAIPAMLQQPVDGDEPHYLIVTDSIARDFDLDLANQYRDAALAGAGRDDLRPFPGDPTGPRGEQYSRHEPFLPLLMVPGYLAGGVAGAVATIALFGVLLVRSTMRWMEDEGVDSATTRLLFPFFALAPPVLFYATRIWPEVPAAFFFVESIRGMRELRTKRWAPALACLVLLKLRFVPVAAGLLAVLAFERRHGARARTKRLVVGAALLAVPLLVMWIAAGRATSVHRLADIVPGGPADYALGLAGLLADGMSGIAFQAPFYLLGLAAIVAWRRTPPSFRMGVAAATPYLLLLAPRAEWFGGWAPPLRYVVFLMPLLALGAASVIRQVPRGVMPLIALWTAALTIHGLVWPWRLFHIFNGENAAGEWLSTRFDSDFSRLFPSFIRLNEAAWPGAAATLLFIVWLGWRGRGEHGAKGTRGEGSTGRDDSSVLLLPPSSPRPVFSAPRVPLAPSLAALAVVAFFHLGRQPASRVDFEDAHVIHRGGALSPELYTMMRTAYRGGWIVQWGESVSFLAREGRWTLHFVTGQEATIDLAGRVYRIKPSPHYQSIEVVVPDSGRVDLRCVTGAINIDRMVRHD